MTAVLSPTPLVLLPLVPAAPPKPLPPCPYCRRPMPGLLAGSCRRSACVAADIAAEAALDNLTAA